MKKALAVAVAALTASLAVNAYQAAPSGQPSKPIYVQRVVQLLEAANTGQWKQACDAAPTAVYSYENFVMIALQYGADDYADLKGICEKVVQIGLTKADGKTPVGLTWEIVYWDADDGKASPTTPKTVLVRLKWNGPGQKEQTIRFQVVLARIQWEGPKAKCKGKPCPALRWYILGAT